MKYVLNFTNGQSISFDLFNNELVDIWSKVITYTLTSTLAKPKPNSTNVTFPTLLDSDMLFRRIAANMDIIKLATPDADWPAEINNLNRFYLNELHQRFHHIMESTNNEQCNHPAVRKASMQVNYDIHALETYFFAKESKDYSNWYLIKFDRPDFHYRKKITDDLRREYWTFRRPERYKNVQLKLGYQTAGKNMFHCVKDDDAKVVRDGMVRPQLDIGCESIFLQTFGMYFKNMDLDPELSQQKYLSRLESFMERHDLYSYIDHTALEHTHVAQPTLGVISDEYDSWTEQDFYNLLSNYDIETVELI